MTVGDVLVRTRNLANSTPESAVGCADRLTTFRAGLVEQHSRLPDREASKEELQGPAVNKLFDRVDLLSDGLVAFETPLKQVEQALKAYATDVTGARGIAQQALRLLRQAARYLATVKRLPLSSSDLQRAETWVAETTANAIETATLALSLADAAAGRLDAVLRRQAGVVLGLISPLNPDYSTVP